LKKSSIQYQLKIPSQTENLELIRDFVYKLAARLGFEDEEASRIELAVDEACTNVIKHAYRGESEELIDIAIKIDYKKMSIIVTDHGKGFDPSSVDMPEMKEYLAADPEVYANPEKYFDRVIEINLSELEPYINGPFTPDLATPLSAFAAAVKENDWPVKMEVGLIGSCTNSSYEDITRSASLAQQAIDKKLKVKSEFTVTPGSELVRYTVDRDGYLDVFRKIGGVVLANACGPCIGQWNREGIEEGFRNSIVTSYNVTGAITLTGPLQDVTKVTATLCDATTKEPVAGVSPVTLTAWIGMLS